MVEFNSDKYKVKSGDCAWNVAKKTLKAQGKKVTNVEIAKEMKRLASLNGCDTVEDFNTKYFSKVGAEFATGQKQVVHNQQKKIPKNSVNLEQDTVARSDNTRVVIHQPVQQKRKVNIKRVKTPVKKSVPKISAKQQEVLHINAMKDDTARIIEYNKKNYDGKFYAIVNKKTCKLNIYNKSGKIVKSFSVGVGKKVGDNLGTHYLDRAEKTKDAWKAENGRYTTPGEFVLDEYKKATSDYTSKKDGKPKVMVLKGDNRGIRSGAQAIHMVPNSNQERNAKIDSATVADNRMSYGCVNLKESDYDILKQYLGEGDKVYILPEEKGNKLQLEKQKDGTYKFAQQYHKKQARGVSNEAASRVNYDIRPNRDPKYIARQKQKVAEQQRLAQQQKAKQDAQKFDIFKPSTWFS